MPTGIPYVINPDGSAGQGWNVTAGCSHVSTGCDNCWAERMARRLRGMAWARPETAGRKTHYQKVLTERGNWNGRVEPIREALTDPLGWRKPRTVFVAEMADLFHEKVAFGFIDQVLAIIALCPWHTFLVLTKRPHLAVAYLADKGRACRVAEAFPTKQPWPQPTFTDRWGHSRPLNDALIADAGLKAEFRELWPLRNLWLGVSVEGQRTADERIPLLLECPAAHRWVRYEPGLGPVDFGVGRGTIGDRGNPVLKQAFGELRSLWACPKCDGTRYFQTAPYTMPCEACQGSGVGIDWVVVGCESGPGKRPFEMEWARSVVEQCREAGTPVFVKQLPINGKVSHDPAEWPKALRVREVGWETSKCQNGKTSKER